MGGTRRQEGKGGNLEEKGILCVGGVVVKKEEGEGQT